MANHLVAVAATHKRSGARVYVQAAGEGDWALNPGYFYPFEDPNAAARLAELFNRKPRLLGPGAQDYHFQPAVVAL